MGRVERGWSWFTFWDVWVGFGFGSLGIELWLRDVVIEKGLFRFVIGRWAFVDWVFCFAEVFWRMLLTGG